MRRILVIALMLAVSLGAQAHVGEHPSVHDTIATVVDRMRSESDAEKLRRFDEEDVLKFVTKDERHVLGTEHWSFQANVPVTVSVIRHTKQREDLFWLKDRGFKKTDLAVLAGGEPYEVWQRKFDRGPVGLGINGFRVHREHYFLAVQPKKKRADLELTKMYPGRHRTATFTEGARPYVDKPEIRLEEYPKALEGATLVRAVQDRAWETQLIGVFRTTPYASTDRPDQVVLTWSGDPKTTQSVQWRTNASVSDGSIQYVKKGAEGDPLQVAAAMSELTDTYLANDAMVHRFTGRLEGLAPATTYAYRVGSAETDVWSDWAEFTTAPAEAAPFSFVYMGDAQNGLDTWGKLVHDAFASRPDAAFYVMAGDLVNRGVERDDWDVFFRNATGVYDRRQLVPAIGNHECQGDNGPWMYLDLFSLPTNGPKEIAPERAYSFEYSNALFVILDTNEPVSAQTAWLEDQLAGSEATWKFVVYHHPAYSSAPNRDNADVRDQWGALFDKYHVDMALQGHDHGYLRTYPMKGGKRASSPKEGTVYLVTVSGTKYYKQDPRDYTEFGMTNVSTYQVLDIQIEGSTLTYRAYDMEGKLRDELVIEK